MSHYGFYIWPCYILVLLLFGYHLVSSWRAWRKTVQNLKK